MVGGTTPTQLLRRVYEVDATGNTITVDSSMPTFSPTSITVLLVSTLSATLATATNIGGSAYSFDASAEEALTGSTINNFGTSSDDVRVYGISATGILVGGLITASDVINQ